MTSYRVYYLDDTGKIAEAERIEAPSDDDALVMMRAKKLAVEVEIWKHNQLLCRVPSADARCSRL